MITGRLRKALDWRFGAVVGRLDALGDGMQMLDRRLGAVESRTDEMAGLVDEVRSLAAAVAEVADHATAVRAAIEEHVHPMLRAIVDEESENRRRLFAVRASPGYEEAFTAREPLVSIVLATVGRTEVLVGRALPSLLAQTHANLEVVVVGDAAGSEVREAVAALGDERVRYANLSQRLVAHPEPERHWRVGSTMARNEAARRARGSWLLHFDDDDHLRPDSIASLLALARERRAEVAYGGFEQHDADGGRLRSVHFPPEPGRFSWSTALVHRGLAFLERELVATALDLPGDMYLLERMLRVGVRFAVLDEVVLDYFPSRAWQPPLAHT